MYLRAFSLGEFGGSHRNLGKSTHTGETAAECCDAPGIGCR